jgi:hypothetical protein
MLFGIATDDLLIEAGFQFNSSIWNTDICSTAHPDNPCEGGDHYLQPDQMFNVNLNLAIEPGLYWLFASPRDPTWGDWHAGSLESDKWVYRDYESNGWQRLSTVDDEGIPWTLPAARIFFSANAVPEPGTLGMLGLALMLLAIVRAKTKEV